MDLITVTKENIEKEHICCAISNNQDCQVSAKKSWLCDRFDDGLVFLKGDVRGKCFIEYIPAEKAWTPIEADGYMYIDCFWISGQFKGQGYSNTLLEQCINDAKNKGKLGLCILSSKKKMGYLSDPKYLKYKGFIPADTCGYFELHYLPFDGTAGIPKFKDCVQKPESIESGFILYYANQCPFTAKYVPMIESMAKNKGLNFKTRHITTTHEAQNAPTPFTSYSLFYDGKLITHEILSEKKFEKLLSDYGL